MDLLKSYAAGRSKSPSMTLSHFERRDASGPILTANIRTYSSTVCSDVVLETRVLVSRRLEDKNESLGLGLGS